MIRFFGWLCRAVGFMTIMAVLILVPMFYYAGQWMQVHDEPRKADYILPLAGDNHRLIYAADLYKQGFAPRILVSLPAQGPHTMMSDMEKKLGYPQFDSKLAYVQAFYKILDIPNKVLTPFGQGHLSTIEESENLRTFLGPGKHTLLLVTSPYHARRAKLIFQSILPETDIIMTVTPYEHFDEKWWKDYYTAPKVVLEAAKCAYYLLGGVFRSTD